MLSEAKHLVEKPTAHGVLSKVQILLAIILFTVSLYPVEAFAWRLWGKKEKKETGDYLIQKEGYSSVYVVHEGKKYPIPPDVLELFGYSGLPVKVLSPKKFDAIPEGQDEWLETRFEEILSSPTSPEYAPPLPEGLKEGGLIRREGDYGVYILHNGKKYLVTDRKAVEDRGYTWSDAQQLSPMDFDAIPEGKDNWFEYSFLARAPIQKGPPQEKYYPPYDEVFRGPTSPYQEDHDGYNYPVTGGQLWGGEFEEFQKKIFSDVRESILSPKELEQRKKDKEEAKRLAKAAELQQRYLEEQIRYQQEQTRLLAKEPQTIVNPVEPNKEEGIVVPPIIPEEEEVVAPPSTVEKGTPLIPPPTPITEVDTKPPDENPLPLAETAGETLGTPVSLPVEIRQASVEQLWNMTWEDIF